MISLIVRLSIRFYGRHRRVGPHRGDLRLVRADPGQPGRVPGIFPVQVVIQTEAPGLSAELVERLVTQPIENAIGGVRREASCSQSIPGLSVVTVVF